MSEENSSIPTDSLERPEGNSLKENYEWHDMGEEWVVDFLELVGYEVVPWGIDKRDSDSDTLIFENDAVDLLVYVDESEGPVFAIEVKTKTSERWFGMFNKRHHTKYVKLNEETDFPIYMVMCLVEDDSITRHFVADMFDDTCMDCGRFPDYNDAVIVKEHKRKGMEYLL